MERAEQVLALRRVDAGLAADGGIDLGQERGGDLYEANATARDGGGKPREIADDTAPERSARRRRALSARRLDEEASE